MPLVTVVMTLTAAFVLLTPIAMAAVLVRGGVPARRAVRVDDGCSCRHAACGCVTVRSVA